jgi:hypothetical protein
MVCSPARSRDPGAPILPRALRRDIILIFVVKVAVLVAIAQLFFHPLADSALNAKAMAQHLLSPNSLSDVDGSR